MAFTYGGDPANSSREAVRFWAGDTDTTDQLLNDAEIDYILTLESQIFLAAALACESIASKFSRKADTENGTLKVWASQRASTYMSKAKDLRRRAAVQSEVYAGGRTKTNKNNLDTDTNDTQPGFKVGQDDNPGTDVESKWDYNC